VPTGESSHTEDVGCVAVRPFLKPVDATAEAESNSSDAVTTTGTCEMKRLFVKQSAQGAGIGRMLIARALQEATDAGYKKMLLDTLERLSAANKLYEASGFLKREPYYHNPLDNVVFWEREL
jgi:GNAT superfamily N-acetyltransferase